MAANPGAQYSGSGTSASRAVASSAAAATRPEAFAASGGAGSADPQGPEAFTIGHVGPAEQPQGPAGMSGFGTQEEPARVAGWVAPPTPAERDALDAAWIFPVPPEGPGLSGGYPVKPMLAIAVVGLVRYTTLSAAGWSFQSDDPATWRDVATTSEPSARVAGADGSMRGLMFEAIRSGRALNTESWIEVECPDLDLVITVPRRAFRAAVPGYAQPLLLGWSYRDQVEACRLRGWISLCQEMVDSAWRSPDCWRIEPVGQFVPGADLGSLMMAARHTQAVDRAVAELDDGQGAPADAMVRAEGKAWILDPHLPTSGGAVLWGWQSPKKMGRPLQPFGYGHDAEWVDYSMDEPPAMRQARVLSTGARIDLLDWYRRRWPQIDPNTGQPAMKPFLDAYEVSR